ncbi:hypothetical protein [Streptomyces justiciae]|uniref:Uncharacterized protein n=1 Tax=Streptomyces justiciae TaxID=2780140 RepID=A0ABU3LVK1_9ACTN|nr:hypothetical protein [Streptomyces justiciae]MDT7843264.1 hypothetical protein [Streptomyces justiciae]
MTPSPAATSTAALTKGGASLVDLLVDAPEIRIAVTGPRMLIEQLTLLTTLSPFDGCTAPRLQELADTLEGTIHCGLVGVEPAQIEVASNRSGVLLQIDLGPTSMYQSELTLRTKTGETLRALITRLLSDDPGRPFFAGLFAVPATGHLEHQHPPGDEPPQPGHDHQGGGHSHGHP